MSTCKEFIIIKNDLSELINTLKKRQIEYTKNANLGVSGYYIANCAGHMGEITFITDEIKCLIESLENKFKNTTKL